MERTRNKLDWEQDLPEDKAALWFLGQAGYMLKSGNCTVLIDPYLTDSVGDKNPSFSRTYPPPVEPGEIRADIFIATHDHTDHMDPKAIAAYMFKDTTMFVSPRHAARHLRELGIGETQIRVVDHGDFVDLPGARIEGVFALATGADVVDTAGYKITFTNGKSVYHTSDTAYCDLLLKACPYADVLLTCINGKFGNLNVAQAIELTWAVKPKYVIPNHYDVMALNSENPKTYEYFYELSKKGRTDEASCVILDVLRRFEW